MATVLDAAVSNARDVAKHVGNAGTVEDSRRLASPNSTDLRAQTLCIPFQEIGQRRTAHNCQLERGATTQDSLRANQIQ